LFSFDFAITNEPDGHCPWIVRHKEKRMPVVPLVILGNETRFMLGSIASEVWASPSFEQAQKAKGFIRNDYLGTVVTKAVRLFSGFDVIVFATPTFFPELNQLTKRFPKAQILTGNTEKQVMELCQEYPCDAE